jgi:uncharacterized protein YpmB
MLVVIYIVVVVCGWMIFRVRAEDIDSAETNAEDINSKDADDLNSGDPGSRH